MIERHTDTTDHNGYIAMLTNDHYAAVNRSLAANLFVRLRSNDSTYKTDGDG